MYSCLGTDEASSHPLWLLRLSSRTGRRFSIDMTYLLTIAVERSGCSAALTKLPDSTTWRNTLTLVSAFM